MHRSGPHDVKTIDRLDCWWADRLKVTVRRYDRGLASTSLNLAGGVRRSNSAGSSSSAKHKRHAAGQHFGLAAAVVAIPLRLSELKRLHDAHKTSGVE